MVDLAEIVRGEGARFLSTHRVTRDQYKALSDIAGCQTELLGTVLEKCQRCCLEYLLFRSCRNRSCPRCQGQVRANWFDARTKDILPVPYVHAVFNAPRELHKLARYRPKPVYDALIRAAGQAVIDVGRKDLKVRLGCQAQFHTWTQDLARHLHTHCVVPCGGFSEDGTIWVSFQPEKLSVGALSRRFRLLACRALREAARAGEFEGLPGVVSVEQILARVRARDWKVYAKPPFGGPEQLLAYLARYINRVAITNDRIESYEDHQVTLRMRGDGDGDHVGTQIFDGQQFLQRIVMHVPPKGFVRTRAFGFLANRNRKANLERARQFIGQTDTPTPEREPVQRQPLRLCPPCWAAMRGGGSPQRPQQMRLAPTLPLVLRPPPTHPVAA